MRTALDVFIGFLPVASMLMAAFYRHMKDDTGAVYWMLMAIFISVDNRRKL